MNKETKKGMELLVKGLKITMEAWVILGLDKKSQAEYSKMKASLQQLEAALEKEQ